MTTHIEYLKRVTTGPYEHEEMKISFSVEKKEDLTSSMETHKNFVYETLNKGTIKATLTAPPITAAATTPKGESNGKSEESKSVSKKDSKKLQEVKLPVPEKEEMEDVPSPFKADAPKEEVKEVKLPKGVVAYDYLKPEHKSTLSNHLTKTLGSKKWAEDKENSKKIAKDDLNGQAFMDAKGEILPSFTAICEDKFKAYKA